MVPIEIGPALEPEEWVDRRFGAISRDAIEGSGDESVVITDPGGRETSVSGSNELFALIALANDAMPNHDTRKITPRVVEVLRRSVAMDRHAGASATPDAVGTGELHALAAVLEALLPPYRRA
jgi:hypothetical protein